MSSLYAVAEERAYAESLSGVMEKVCRENGLRTSARASAVRTSLALFEDRDEGSSHRRTFDRGTEAGRGFSR